MNKLLLSLKELKTSKNERPALMTHVVLGYPSLNESINIVCAMSNSGAKFIELQIPFSDPMADGPSIMHANEVALSQGITPIKCLKTIEKLAKIVSVPLIIMSYFNLLYRYKSKSNESGLKNFLKDASSSGASALIIPDIPPEEKQEQYWTTALDYNLISIPLVSPLSSEKRLNIISKTASNGFVYCIATTGVTGVRNKLPEHLDRYLARIRRYFSLPLALGFGISTPEQIQMLSGKIEIAIVGSAMINLISKTSPSKLIPAVSKFTKNLAGL